MEDVKPRSKFDDFKPDLKYLRKIYLFSGISSFFFIILFALPASFFLRYIFGELSESVPLLKVFVNNYLIIFILVAVLFVILSFGWSKLQYNALNYQLTRSELVVKSGVIFKKDVVIPMRTITNIDVISGPFDRAFGIATMNVQTAGSVSILAEGRFVGLLQGDANELRDSIKARLQNIQGGDGTGIDGGDISGDPVERVLFELREIKNVLIDIRDKNE